MIANVSIPWSDAERRQLRQLRDNGLSMRQIAAHMGRSKNSVSRQMRNMGLAANERAPGAVKRPGAHPKAAVVAPLRAGRTTLPPLPSLRGVLRDEDWCTTDPLPSLPSLAERD